MGPAGTGLWAEVAINEVENEPALLGRVLGTSHLFAAPVLNTQALPSQEPADPEPNAPMATAACHNVSRTT